ncbi:RNA polymerase sigma factor [Woeseia oceani]|uniref:RNA polymerase sigma factor n=1 Tax=Woeseia oceani TaxID=1548547 RepID=UPI0018D462E2|nr:sigma-70 family RNA polymerase sigma factor [Woeseia oceani]
MSGDADCFGELIRRHQSQLRLFLLRLCREPSLADDLAQDALMHAFEKLDGFRGDGSFAGWLMRIAWTTFLQSRRRADRYRQVVELAAQEPAATSTSPAQDEVSDLDRLLAVLTTDERAIMILAYSCGMSHSEISKAVDLPVGTVKSVIHRSKQKIRQDFEIDNHQFG